MSSLSNNSYRSSVLTAEAVLKAALHSWNLPRHAEIAHPPRAFVTISRQPGADGGTLAHQLAERLNEEPGGDWSAWDDELLNKVSAEHGIAKHVIEAVEQQPQSWLEVVMKAFSTSDKNHVEEQYVYRRVAMTIRALASAGHTIIVGRGGQFVTATMPAGIHVRLVAPLDYRIKHIAGKYNIPLHAAAKQITEAEHGRKSFYHRYWPDKERSPESFTMTLNVAELSLDELVECIVTLVHKREASALHRRCEKCLPKSAAAKPALAAAEHPTN